MSALRIPGATGNDYVYLNNIQLPEDVVGLRVGDSLYVTSEADIADGFINSGVYIEGWYDGGNTIEWFATADGTHFRGTQFDMII